MIHSLSFAQSPYFPPLNTNAHWDTLSPSSLGWCLNEVDSLYNYLDHQNTKAFILLKDGKIVLEKYFDNFTQDSLWYWASAGKTITSFLVGKAQEENYLSITDSSSRYLAAGWTNSTPIQERKIEIRHQLSMTTGLDDGVVDNHCTIDTCLNYLADAGTRWSYHNAPYTLLENVLEAATGVSINVYTQQKLKSNTGMKGSWIKIGYDNVYFSDARSMARFGLLMQNKGIWNSDTLLKDSIYIRESMQSSQNYNLSYGYLWWLNGKSSYMLPGITLVLPGFYAPEAPSDMVAGLGKNGQIVSLSRTEGLVMVRLGEDGGPEVPTVLCNKIWERINAIRCNTTELLEIERDSNPIRLYPNPAKEEVNLTMSSEEDFEVEVCNALGKTIRKEKNQKKIDVSQLSRGYYFLKVQQGGVTKALKFWKE